MTATRASPADRGSATVTTLGIGAALLALALLPVLLASAITTRHRAQTAADFAALAAAGTALQGTGPACARADQIAAANGATLVSCDLSGLDATVTVAVAPTAPLSDHLTRPTRATASAGPITAPQGARTNAP